MKEFDEWWLMEAQNIVGVGRAQEVDVATEAWKAALEWVKNTCDLYDRCGGWQGYIVEDELED